MELSLEAGLKKFSNSAILHEWMLKKNELFHEPHDDEVANETSETETESDNESSDNEIEDGDEDVCVSHHSPAAFETPQPVREEELTFTQVLDQPGVAEEVSAMIDQTGLLIIQILSSSDWNMHYPLNSYQNLQNTHCLHRSYFDPSIKHTTHIYYEPNIKTQNT
ncbi:hypothetical protein LXL04_000319 [Taraxacum kok-saghyz]